jgi:hypothetical protein
VAPSAAVVACRRRVPDRRPVVVVLREVRPEVVRVEAGAWRAVWRATTPARPLAEAVFVRCLVLAGVVARALADVIDRCR